MDPSRQKVRLFTALALVAAVAPARVLAADSRAFDLDHVKAAISGSDFLGTEGAGRRKAGMFRLALGYTYTDSPLTRIHSDGPRETLIGGRHVLDISGGVQIASFIGLAVAFPVLMQSTGTEGAGGPAIGDLRIAPRFDMVNRRNVGLALLAEVRLPTGNSDRFVGEGAVTFEPRLATEVYLADGLVRIGINAGVRVRKTKTFGELAVGNEVFGKVALAVVPKPWITAAIELHADSAMDSRFGQRQVSPVEALVSLGGGAHGFRATAGAGLGVVDGWGAPRVRAMLSLEYRREPPPKKARPQVVVPRPQVIPGCVPPSLFPGDEEEEAEEEVEEEGGVRFIGGRIELADPIFFDNNRARVRTQFREELEGLAEVLQRRTEVGKVWIEGHADATGPEHWNIELSRLRARAVARYLEAHGVPAGRLEPVGFGEAKPLIPTKHGVANGKNRRVHFYTDLAPAPSAPMSSR